MSRNGGYSNLKLWVAQGFGVGRIPAGPGTFGSIIGVGWFALLLALGHLWLFILGALAAIAASVWLCGEGERILGQTDPGSIVLDEIAAMPLCFGTWLIVDWSRAGHLLSVRSAFSGQNWLVILAVFALFRLFDVTKPPPVRQSQALPGGWGVTVDDLLAAVYVNLTTAVIHFFWF